jgi:hypothetical protein
MSVQAILFPVFVQVLLTAVLLLRTVSLRVPALRGGRVRPADVALDDAAFPERARQFGNAYSNQFELPVLFYVLVILAMQTKQADVLFVVMSWMFVVSRVVHAWIHTSGNDLSQRGLAFAFGATVLLLMWLIYALRLLLAL